MAQIIPIKELKNTNNISKLCEETNDPIFVTKNGYGNLVIMSMKTYEEKLARVEMYEQLAVAEEQFKYGETLEAKKSLSKIRNKYGL